jgi:hypothetical protein
MEVSLDVVHYQGSSLPVTACGIVAGKDARMSSSAGETTCRACLRTNKFKEKFPDLYSPSSNKGGRPGIEGQDYVLRIRLGPELAKWLEGKRPYSTTIVEALQKLKEEESVV